MIDVILLLVVYISTIKKTVSGVAHIVEPNELSDDFTLTSVSDSTNGCYIARTFNASNEVTDEFKDQKTNILFYNASTSDAIVHIKAGDSYAACNDLDITVKGQKYHFVQIDSAYFKVVSGADAPAIEGAVHIVPEATVSVAVIENR